MLPITLNSYIKEGSKRDGVPRQPFIVIYLFTSLTLHIYYILILNKSQVFFCIKIKIATANTPKPNELKTQGGVSSPVGNNAPYKGTS